MLELCWLDTLLIYVFESWTAVSYSESLEPWIQSAGCMLCPWHKATIHTLRIVVVFSLVHLDGGNCPFGFSVESFCPLCVSLPNIQWLIKVKHTVQARVMQFSHFLFLNFCLFSFWLNFCPVSGTGLSPSHSSHCVWGAPNFHVALKDFDLDVLLVLPALNALR